MTKSSSCFWKCDRKSGCRFCVMVCPKFCTEYCILIYTHHWELMKTMGRHSSWPLLVVTEVMVWHLVSNTLIRLWLYSLSCYLQNVILETSLQSHRYMYMTFIKNHALKVLVVSLLFFFSFPFLVWILGLPLVIFFWGCHHHGSLHIISGLVAETQYIG